MYYRHNLSYEYPEECDGHVISVKRPFVNLTTYPKTM